MRFKAVSLKLGSAGVWGSERRKFVTVKVLLAVLNLYLRIKIPVGIFDTNHSDTVITQSIAASIQKLPDSAV
jgi:hypothetical protein